MTDIDEGRLLTLTGGDWDTVLDHDPDQIELLKRFPRRRRQTDKTEWSYDEFLPLETLRADTRGQGPLSPTAYLAVETALLDANGVDRAVQYAYETRRRFPDRRVFLTGELIFPLEHWHNHASMVVELPDGDLFAAVRSGGASVVTDRIETFTEDGWVLMTARLVGNVLLWERGELTLRLDLREQGNRHLPHRDLAR